ncbi:Protein of unknown function [Gryllus bimaculatus]|nr:Protein of unknown function [Gryllus bimaculatus]
MSVFLPSRWRPVPAHTLACAVFPIEYLPQRALPQPGLALNSPRACVCE